MRRLRSKVVESRRIRLSKHQEGREFQPAAAGIDEDAEEGPAGAIVPQHLARPALGLETAFLHGACHEEIAIGSEQQAPGSGESAASGRNEGVNEGTRTGPERTLVSQHRAGRQEAGVLGTVAVLE